MNLEKMCVETIMQETIPYIKAHTVNGKYVGDVKYLIAYDYCKRFDTYNKEEIK